jgi:hypothetical protein
MGTWISDEDINEDMLNAIRIKTGDDSLTEDDIRDDFLEFLFRVIDNKTTDLSFDFMDYCDEIYVGISYEKMKEDETLGAFKKRVIEELKRVLGIQTTKIHHIENCYHNG